MEWNLPHISYISLCLAIGLAETLCVSSHLIMKCERRKERNPLVSPLLSSHRKKERLTHSSTYLPHLHLSVSSFSSSCFPVCLYLSHWTHALSFVIRLVKGMRRSRTIQKIIYFPLAAFSCLMRSPAIQLPSSLSFWLVGSFRFYSNQNDRKRKKTLFNSLLSVNISLPLSHSVYHFYCATRISLVSVL